MNKFKLKRFINFSLHKSLSLPSRCYGTRIPKDYEANDDYDESGERSPYRKGNVDGRPLYLDSQSTTRVDERVIQKMMPYFRERYGNAHSRTHAYGWESEAAVEKAREQISSIIGAESKEIIWTSGATESNNLAIKGIAEFYQSEKKRHLITCQTEHKCVLASCRHLEQKGFRITYLPVENDGRINLEELENSISSETIAVSIMMVNNEIGVIQPINEIGEICRNNKIFFHTDAAQAFGKIPINVSSMNIDLMSISSHKFYGPKGVGALYVRRRPRVRLIPQISGGGQERGLRSGTLPTPLIVGMGEAGRLCEENKEKYLKRIRNLSNLLLDILTKNLSHVYRNGSIEHTYPGCINLSFAYVEGESLLMALKDIALSSGSACTSASLEPSYVLRALGQDEDLAHSSIRFGIDKYTTEADIEFTANKIIYHVKRLREMSPLWEMVQEGIDLKTIQWKEPKV
ncbi:hypothetical protein SNEBB_009283 [Seison nebaliae]|nr:hypothetical protein SNEBB_009283 [Seison nebaliae]